MKDDNPRSWPRASWLSPHTYDNLAEEEKIACNESLLRGESGYWLKHGVTGVWIWMEVGP